MNMTKFSILQHLKSKFITINFSDSKFFFSFNVMNKLMSQHIHKKKINSNETYTDIDNLLKICDSRSSVPVYNMRKLCQRMNDGMIRKKSYTMLNLEHIQG